MTKVDIITTSGEKKGSAEIKTSKKISSGLVSSVVLAGLSNKRQAIAHTKTKGEVSGGGKKPYKQKGNGRARAGSNRSPLWIGGGTTFGPRNNASFYKRINKKQRLVAIREIFQEKAESGFLKIVDTIAINSGKTKDMVKALSSMGIDGSTLLILDDKTASLEEGTRIYNSGRNIDFLQITNVKKINAFMILKYKWLVLTNESFEFLNNKFSIVESRRENLVEEKK